MIPVLKANYGPAFQLWKPEDFPLKDKFYTLTGEGQPHKLESDISPDEDGPPPGLVDNRVVLSIRQPWAFLIVNGIKDVENRTWSTAYRGELWIHAGGKVEMEMIPILRGFGYTIPDILQTGGIVGRTRLVDVASNSRSEWFSPQGDRGKAWCLDVTASRPVPFQKMRGFLQLFKAGDAYK